METDLSNPETTDEQGPSQVRSYECTFCKRGFSNAQALGGHMNIHRKDKAKLKQASNETQQSLNIPKTAPSYFPISKYKLQPPEIKSNTIKWPWILTGEDDATARDETRVGELRQLPLFAETPSNTEYQKPSSHVGSSSLELDLELRLGPDPQDSSAGAGTKKFF